MVIYLVLIWMRCKHALQHCSIQPQHTVEKGVSNICAAHICNATNTFHATFFTFIHTPSHKIPREKIVHRQHVVVFHMFFAGLYKTAWTLFANWQLIVQSALIFFLFPEKPFKQKLHNLWQTLFVSFQCFAKTINLCVIFSKLSL